MGHTGFPETSVNNLPLIAEEYPITAQFSHLGSSNSAGKNSTAGEVGQNKN
jgi:hypothetical protein